MSSSSTILTMGTAISRAADAGATIQLLVGGTWNIGDVVAQDGFGVVLRVAGDLLVFRLEKVDGVRISERVAYQTDAYPALPPTPGADLTYTRV